MAAGDYLRRLPPGSEAVAPDEHNMLVNVLNGDAGPGAKVGAGFFASNPPTGTVASPIQGVERAWGGPWYDVMSPKNPSGAAKGDGVTDDTAAIQAAVNAISFNSAGAGQGGTVYFPPGIFKTTAPITVGTTDYKSVKFQGAGSPGYSALLQPGVSIVKGTGNYHVFDCGQTAANSNGEFVFDNIHIQGPGASTTGAAGIVLHNTNRAWLSRITVSDFKGGYGVWMKNDAGQGQYLHALDCDFNDCLIGALIEGESWFTGCNFDGHDNLVYPSFSPTGSGQIGVSATSAISFIGGSIQSYEIGIKLTGVTEARIVAPRLENFVTGVWLTGNTVSSTIVTAGWFANGALSAIGVKIDAGSNSNWIGGPPIACTTPYSMAAGALYNQIDGIDSNMALLSGTAGVSMTGINGNGVLAIGNRFAAPTTDASGGFMVYSEVQSMRLWSGNGTRARFGGLQSFQGGTYTMNAYDEIVYANSGSAQSVVLPVSSASIKGYRFAVKRQGAGAITISTQSSQTIDGAATKALNSQWASIEVVSDGSNWQIVSLVGTVA